MKNTYLPLSLIVALIFGAVMISGWNVRTTAGEPVQRSDDEREPERPAPPRPSGSDGDAASLLKEVKTLKNQIKEMSVKLDELKAVQEAIKKSNALLVTSKWEYKVESTYGGSRKEKLKEILDKMGKDGFEYAGMTDDGLFIFRKRVVEE
ncbi:MAG: hypothetical protein JXR97_14705 [Planctomycetes bacterium]|nr:hypothetical protein [Planctomycetota bacterium]